MDPRVERINKAAGHLADLLSKAGLKPQVGIVLGSGLGKLADKIEDRLVVPFKEIPGFPVSTAIGHKGNLIAGHLGGKSVLAMQGRFHFYEGYDMDSVTLPQRVMSVLGIKWLFVSNAAGGLTPESRIGDLMIIRDQINMLPNPLVGPNLDEFGPRFPDMTRPYDLKLIALAKETAAQMGLSVREGVYLGCTGPSFETPAECAFMHKIGADAVGMSTTPEVIVARHSGMRVFGMSVITDVVHESPEDYIASGEEVIKQADAAADKMSSLFAKLIARL